MCKIYLYYSFSIVFIGYAVCRIRKWYLLRKKAENIKFVNAVCVPAFAVMLMMLCLAAKSSPVKNSSIVKPAAVKIAEDEPVEDNTTAITSSEMVTSSTTAETAKDTTETTVTTATEETTEETTESVTEEETEAEEESADEEIAEEEESAEEEPKTEPEPEPETEPEPLYIYNNGTYTAAAYGYDGDIEVSVTIENDVIVDITGVTYESDSWYYDSAAPHVISQILNTQSTQVDAYSGATYSSDAIMAAVAAALDMARK